jgi:hypothetical protein
MPHQAFVNWIVVTTRNSHVIDRAGACVMNPAVLGTVRLTFRPVPRKPQSNSYALSRRVEPAK